MAYFMKKADYEKRKAATKARIAKNLTTIRTPDPRGTGNDFADDADVRVKDEHISLAKYLRGGVFGVWDGAEVEKRIYAKRFELSKADLGSTSESAGGLFVPDVVSATLIPRLQEKSVLRALGCSVVTVKGFQKYIYPVQGTAPTITHDGESDTLTADTSMDFDPGNIEQHRTTCLIYAPVELMMNANIDMESQIRNDIADQMALDEDAQAFRGLGGTQALGLLYQPRVNSTDLSGEIDQDDITNAAYQVDKAHGALSAWVGDKALGWKISKLKDAEGRYLFPQTGQHANLGANVKDLGGVPLFQTTQIGVGSYPGSNETYLIGGDWARFMLLDGGGLMVDVTREGGDAWTKAKIGVRVVKWFGCGPLLPATFVVVKGISGT
ncbi:MAG TPA: phage major capsid protein [Phycisphaerae bacterium]|nr:phage major capsid protein [Phycisphaerae bacterium]